MMISFIWDEAMCCFDNPNFIYELIELWYHLEILNARNAFVRDGTTVHQ